MSGCADDVRASLAQAKDVQVARVVAMVDALPERGAADALIAPLRPRLAALRPARPAGFTRVLFTPLDPLIMSLAEWQCSGTGVPRPLLTLFARAVRHELPDFADAVEAGGHIPEASHWAAAAAVLDALLPPPNWEDSSGLGPSDWRSIATTVAAVLREAHALDALALHRRPPDDGAIWSILSRSNARGREALDAVVSVMLARLPFPDRVAALAAEAFGKDGLIGRTIDRLAQSVASRVADGGDLQDAAKEATRVATLLSAIEQAAAPDRRARLDAIRREADGSCRHTYALAAALTVASAIASAAPSLDDEDMAALESSARDLRRLASAGRMLGSAAYYEQALSDAAAKLEERCGMLRVADRVRLLEILAGPERALTELLGGQIQGSSGVVCDGSQPACYLSPAVCGP